MWKAGRGELTFSVVFVGDVLSLYLLLMIFSTVRLQWGTRVYTLLLLPLRHGGTSTGGLPLRLVYYALYSVVSIVSTD